MADKIVLVAVIFLLVGTNAAAGSAPSPRAGNGKETVRLDEVKISGSAEHPGVLFFLPRTRFHLLPLRPETGETEALPRGNGKKGPPVP